MLAVEIGQYQHFVMTHMAKRSRDRFGQPICNWLSSQPIPLEIEENPLDLALTFQMILGIRYLIPRISSQLEN